MVQAGQLASLLANVLLTRGINHVALSPPTNPLMWKHPLDLVGLLSLHDTMTSPQHSLSGTRTITGCRREAKKR